MSPDVTTPPSEGEIVESSSEKANTLITASYDTKVDRHSRTRQNHASSSEGPQYAPSFVYERNRERSRSPYREPRGLKRSREGERRERSGYDPRRFRIRYEDSHRLSPREKMYVEDTVDTAQPARTRDRYKQRSREAGFSHKALERHGFGHTNIDSPVSVVHKGEGGGVQQYANSEQKARPQVAMSAHKSTSHPRNDHQEVISRPAKQPSANEFVTNSIQASVLTDLRAPHLEHSSAQTAGNDQSGLVSTPDEADLIERRRKRREAIKAKYRPPNQDTSMSVDDLKSEPQRPKNSQIIELAENSTSATGYTSARTNQIFTTQYSDLSEGRPFLTPAHSARETGLGDSVTNTSTTLGEDGPSAADYDPTMDMPEDKMKQDAMVAFTMDDSNIAPASVNVPSPIPKAENHNNEFDMFAEDGPSDKSAEGLALPTNDRQTHHGDREPHAQAKAIDMTMLDDSDDSEGYYKVILGELLDERYHVTSNLGKGMFSGVVRATDQQTNHLVAIKIVRNNEIMFKAGLKEIGILQKLKTADIEDKKHLIRLERSFEHKGHLCMVFENLSINLREVLKKFGRDIGINLKAVRAYAQQMFLGLSLLRRCNILHADLKPDNVLVNEMRNALKICDLGSASDASEADITQYLVSRFYRAPEIILGLPYDFAIDMWSVGCTLFELYTGKILFTGRNNNQMLRAMMECRGKFGHKMLRKAQFASHHFDDLLNFRSLEKDRLTGKESVRLVNIVKPSRDLKTRLMGNAKGLPDSEAKELLSFADLLDRCLSLNPEKRCTPLEALRHPFIVRQK